MKNSRQWILATAIFFSLSLWVGTASVAEPVTTSATLDTLNAINGTGASSAPSQPSATAETSDPVVQDEIDVGGALGSGQMGAISTGNGSASMAANSDPDAMIVDNDIGDNSRTGDVGVFSANAGGINVNFANSGNNVVMQNSMAVNIYLGPGQQP